MINYKKITTYKYTLISILLLTHLISCSNSIENWKNMQYYYQVFLDAAKNHLAAENALCHQNWQNLRPNIQKIINGQYKPDFFSTPEINCTMIRSGMGVGQQYELCFLTECISSKIKNLVATFQDTTFGNLPKECQKLNCSNNTLGHLFYAARTLESIDKEPEIIIEFGGGYGNLARIYKHFLPNATYVIIDLPEILALQYFFLKETTSEKNVIFHSTIPESYETSAIHLIPATFLDQINNLSGDLFVSTLALSETSAQAQHIVKNKKFFNAKMVYIVGQLNDSTGTLNGGFPHHDLIHSAIRTCYQKVDCHPFHFILNNLMTYEIIAQNPIKHME